MKSSTAVSLACLLAIAVTCAAAYADGMFVPSASDLEKSRITEPQQKAAIYYSNGIEKLIISPSFKGAADKFAWVIPVPARPKVSILDGAIFHELKSLTTPRFPRGSSRKGGAPGSAPPDVVQVLERKTVGAYDVSVLKSTDANALTKWLRTNGYRLPEPDPFVRKRIDPVGYYVKNHWTFVACRVKAPGKAQGLRMGELAPIMLSFRSRNIIYPLKLSSLNPADFSLLIYLLLPSSRFSHVGWHFNATDAPKDASEAILWTTLPAKQSKHPTLARLSRDKLRVFVLNRRLQPYECNKDITWAAR